MHACILQHVPYEGPASMVPWLKAAGYQIAPVHLYMGDPLPAMDAVSFLAVMGGPMSVNDEDQHPWLRREKTFIRRAIEAGKPVLGVCLGAQLIASVLGARVYPNPVKEIGWFPVEGIPQKDTRLFSFSKSTEVLHWHGETFDLPDGAVHLARSTHCENQAFQYGPRVMGLQFHLEMTPTSLAALAGHCADELKPGRTVQAEAELLGRPKGRYRAMNKEMDRVLAYLHRTVA